MDEHPRLVVLLGSSFQVSYAAHILGVTLRSALITQASSATDVLDAALRTSSATDASSTESAGFPMLQKFKALSPEWPAPKTRAAARIRTLEAVGNVRHDLLVESRLVGR